MLRVLEKLIIDKFFSVVFLHLSAQQHGFRKKRSTFTNHIDYLHHLYLDFVNPTTDYLLTFYVDFQEAFDRDNYSILLKKLILIGIGVNCLKVMMIYPKPTSLRRILPQYTRIQQPFIKRVKFQM